MKKTIAILLVAILAVGSVFALDANLSGKFTSKLAYDIEDNWLGFTEPDNALDLTLELTTATENEGDVYASVKAEMKLLWETDGKADGSAQTEDDLFDLDADNTFFALNNDDSKFEITEVAIYGNGWNLSILKAAEMSKYANGWETYNDGDDNVDLEAPVEYKNNLGATFTLDNIFQAGVASDIDFDENGGKYFLAWAATDDLNFGGITVNAAAGVTRTKASAEKDLMYIGLGAQAGYTNDTISLTVGTDMSIGVPTEDKVDATLDLDLAASFAYADMVTVDAYYASATTLAGDDAPIDTYEIDGTGYQSVFFTGVPVAVDGLGRAFIVANGEDYLSTKIGFDLNAFDVPVAFTLVGMDLIKNPYIDLEAKVNVAGFEITAFGGYQALMQDKYNSEGKKDGRELTASAFHFGGEVAYTLDPIGKLSAGITYLGGIANEDNADLYNALGLEVALENTTLVSGATLKAGYKTANIVDGDYALFTSDAGEIYVQATIEF